MSSTPDLCTSYRHERLTKTANASYRISISIEAKGEQVHWNPSDTSNKSIATGNEDKRFLLYIAI